MTFTLSHRAVDARGLLTATTVDGSSGSTRLVVFAALVAIVAVAVLSYQLARRRTLAQAAQASVESGAAARLHMLESLLRQTPNLVNVRDLSGRYLLANEPFQRLIGATQDVEGTAEPLVAPDMAKLRLESDAEALQGLHEYDGWLDVEDGRRFYSRVKFPLHDPQGEVYAIASIGVDLTSQERALQVLAEARDAAVFANSAKSTLLATVSHEIRAPMNAVIGTTDLLLDTDLDPSQQEFVETIRSSADALLGVIDNILDFSWIEFGELELDVAPFDVRDQIEGSIDAVSAQAAARGVDLLCYVDESCPTWVSGDAGRLRQIVTNLLLNAVKFTTVGEVVLEVSGEESADGRINLRVSVADTGVGMEPAAVDRLFSPFFLADASTTRAHGGSGLGLVICQRLAAAMSGELSATSTPGVGSTFTLTVLVDKCERPLTAVVRNSVAHLTGRWVLVVDDNLANLRILDQQLSTWGMLCATASTQAEALRLLRTGTPYDVALVDARMPDLTGAALASAIHDVAGRENLPLVLLSSQSQPTGGDGVFAARLTKPTKSAALRDVLASVVATAAAVALPAPAAPAVAAAGTRLRILLAEDNPVNQRVAKLMLAKLGHDVDTVSDGRQAVAAAAAHPYDVIMMDIQMPDMDGKEATCEIRASAGHQPRIVAMTASVLVQDQEACAAAGMDDYLSKPVRVQALRAALEGVVAMNPPVGRPDTGPDPRTAAPPTAVTVERVAAAPAPERVGALSEPRPVLRGGGASPAAAEPPAVDVSALDDLVKQLDPRDTGLRDVLLNSYLDEGSAQVGRLLMAATTSDLPTVIAMSHTLRSTSALLGAANLAALLQLTEDAARGDTSNLGSLARQIDLEHTRVVAELNEMRRPTAALH